MCSEKALFWSCQPSTSIIHAKMIKHNFTNVSMTFENKNTFTLPELHDFILYILWTLIEDPLQNYHQKWCLHLQMILYSSTLLNLVFQLHRHLAVFSIVGLFMNRPTVLAFRMRRLILAVCDWTWYIGFITEHILQSVTPLLQSSNTTQNNITKTLH